MTSSETFKMKFCNFLRIWHKSLINSISQPCLLSSAFQRSLLSFSSLLFFYSDLSLSFFVLSSSNIINFLSSFLLFFVQLTFTQMHWKLAHFCTISLVIIHICTISLVVSPLLHMCPRLSPLLHKCTGNSFYHILIKKLILKGD